MPSHFVREPAITEAHLIISFDSRDKIDSSLKRAFSLLEVMAEALINKNDSYAETCMMVMEEITTARCQLHLNRQGGAA